MAKVKKIKDVSHEDIPFSDIKQWYDEFMHPDKIDLDDQAVYEYVYHNARWGGIFQCTGKGAQKFFEKAKPESIIDIATLTSIYRPGPLAAKVDQIYIDAKKGKHYEWPDARIGEILKNTYGCIIFQEQVMELAEKCAGFPKDQCDEVRRAIMKRSISGGEAAKKTAAETRENFVKGCVQNQYTEEVANLLYDRILYFAGYGFNKCFTSKEKIKVRRNNIWSDVEIQHVIPGDCVLSRDEVTQEIIIIEVKHLHDTGYNEVVRLELTTGEIVECTMNHKFRTMETGEMLPLWQIQERNLSVVVDSAVSLLKNKNG